MRRNSAMSTRGDNMCAPSFILAPKGPPLAARPAPARGAAVSTAQPPGTGLELARRAALFVAPPRLGWVFRDRRQLLAPFGEPPPVQSQSLPPQLEAERAAAEQALRKTQRRITPFSVILLIGFLLLAGCDRAMFGGGPALGAVVIGLLAGGPGLVLTGVRYARA